MRREAGVNVQFRVLGRLEIFDGGQPIEISAPKQRALLLLLLVHAGNIVSTDTILDTLWPQEAPTGDLKTVHFHISKLRKALEPASSNSGFSVVETRGNGYLIDPAHHEIDARRFEELGSTGHSELETRPDRAQRLLTEALSLWRGPAFLDVEYDDFAALEQRRLEGLRLAAVESRIDAELRLGRSVDLVVELEGLVAEHPDRERPTELLMHALYAAGRSADAVAAGRALRDLLGEKGLEPKPSLTALEDQILRHDLPVAAARDMHIGRIREPRLPTSLTSFIGRSVEIHDVRTLIANGRLLTLVGSPGSGKTRLGLEVARQLDANYSDGAIMVELSEVADPHLVPQAVSTALGISAPVGADYTELIVSTLHDRESLVVLDNCEHVVGNAARLTLSILQACPRVKVLATSREALGVPGERVWPVPPFALPPDGGRPAEQMLDVESIRLFVDRATETNPRFVADSSNLDAIEMICRRLDALPLAIELAASTVEALTPHQIAERLENRFVEVPSGRRPGLAHQATMEAAVRWSYDLLDPVDRTVFIRLSVLAGGFSMDAAEAVAGWGVIDRVDVFDSVLRLVHKSLLIPVTGSLNTVRYRMLTVLRQFGSRMLRTLDETDETDRQHAEYYAALSETLAPHFQGSQEAPTRERADLELDNFRHALDSSLTSGRAETAIQITAALTWYWYWRSYYTEGLSWARRALAAAPDPKSADCGQVLFTVGLFENIAGNYAAAADSFREAYDIARAHGLPAFEASSLTGLGVIMRDCGQLALALEYFHQAVETDRAIGDKAHLALTLRFAASVNFMLGRVAEAAQQAEESYVGFEELGHRGGMGWALETQCRIAFRLGQGNGFDLAGRARNLFVEVHDRRNEAWVLIRMAESHLQSGWHSEARAETQSSLEIFVELNDGRGIAYAVLRGGLVALASRRFDEAGADLRRALRLFLDLGDDGGTATASGFLACMAIRERDKDGAVAHAARWLAVPTADRYAWSFLDVLCQLAINLEKAGYANADVIERRDGYEAALLSGGDMEAAGKTLDDIPMLLGTTLSK